MNKPPPVPPVGCVTYFENRFGRISGFIPAPISLIFTIASLSCFSASIVIRFSSDLAVNFIALHNRFEITSNILTLSALTMIDSERDLEF